MLGRHETRLSAIDYTKADKVAILLYAIWGGWVEISGDTGGICWNLINTYAV